MRSRGLLIAAACLLSAASHAVAADQTAVAGYQAAYRTATDAYRGRLSELAAWCREHQLGAEADLLAAWLPPADSPKQHFYLLPIDGNPTSPTAESDAPADAQAVDRGEFRKRFSELRTARAEELFELAREAAGGSQFSSAVRWGYETLREDPDHAAARKLLGYRNATGAWRTTFEEAKHRAGRQWHARFGWIEAEHAARYESGERYLNGRWVSAADDAKIHATIERGWEVQTEHFRIRTNHSLEEGARLAARLEQMQQVWRQMFARYHTPEAEWRRRFAGGELRSIPAKPLAVVYYRSRDEYVSKLKRREPRIEQTAGIYMVDDETAYFYFDSMKRDDAFLFHEVTHQLFSAERTTLRVGAKANFWIVEGIACQFESLRLPGDGDLPSVDRAELGGYDNPRITAARVRLLDDNFYVPLVELTAMSMQVMQKDARLPTLYSQASGQADFLMHGEQGRYREATVDYLTAVYSGRDTPATLAERTGVAYDELDRQYRAYIESLPKR